MVQGDAKTGAKAQWKAVSDLADLVQDIVNYEVKHNLIAHTMKSQEMLMEIEEPKEEIQMKAQKKKSFKNSN